MAIIKQSETFLKRFGSIRPTRGPLDPRVAVKVNCTRENIIYPVPITPEIGVLNQITKIYW